MPKTVAEYIEQTKGMIERGEVSESIEPASAILFINHNSSMVGGGVIYVPDFGQLVCYCRYEMAPLEFDPDDYWQRSGVPKEELPQRLAAVENGLDQLLEAFVQLGYQPEMGEALLDIWNEHSVECEFISLYVLPDDLDALIQQVGNPLAPEDDDTGGEEDAQHQTIQDMMAQIEQERRGLTAESVGFDLHNPEHRQKLAERLFEVA